MEVYRHPANRFVGGFIGSPAMNFVRCELGRNGATTRLRSPFFDLELPNVEEARTGAIDLGARPQDIAIVPEAEGDFSANVDVIEPLGNELLIHVAPEADQQRLELRIVADADATVEEGHPIGLRLRRDGLHLFDAESGDRLN